MPQIVSRIKSVAVSVMPNWMETAGVVLFPLYFVGLWLLVGTILAWKSGWSALAERYSASTRPSGTAIFGQVTKFGSVSEGNVTRIIVAQEGLFLEAILLFRFKRPALLIPWTMIGWVRQGKMLWWSFYELDLAGTTSIRITRKAYEALKEHIPVPQTG